MASDSLLTQFSFYNIYKTIYKAKQKPSLEGNPKISVKQANGSNKPE